MKQLNVRLPDDLHAALKARAEREHRSMHAEILYLITREVRKVHAIPLPPERGSPLA